MAPHVTAQAIKGAVFAAAVFDRIGFHVSPAFDEPRSDLIQTIYLENEKTCAFLPRESRRSRRLMPMLRYPRRYAGYADKIIMQRAISYRGHQLNCQPMVLSVNRI